MRVNCAGFMSNGTFFSHGTGDVTRMDLTVSIFSEYSNLMNLRMDFCVKLMHILLESM
jgi:hypothetical protein